MVAASGRETADRFEGFGPQALAFLTALAFHQDRAWFEENRGLYERDVKAPLESLLADLSGRFAERGLPLQGGPRSVFRLHRDVRFGKDKRPYKTNGGAVLTREGTKKSPGLLYLHLDPAGCFAAAGFYRPEPDQLAALRRRIVTRPKAYRAAVKQLEKAGLPLGEGDPLARAPRGFEEVGEPDLAEAVRRRSFVVRRPIDAKAILAPSLADALVRFGEEAAPLLRFGWEAIDAATPDPRGAGAAP